VRRHNSQGKFAVLALVWGIGIQGAQTYGDPGRASGDDGGRTRALRAGARAMTAASPPALPSRSAFGHPRGLTVLAMTEVWERFSFYGMRALLVLYMIDVALRPGASMLGLGLLRQLVGPVSVQAAASTVYGFYAGFVYFTPLAGGAVGDRWLGQRRTVLAGALLMAAGHLLMAFQATFLVALVLLVLGCGGLKGNITAQVGALYHAGDPRRAAGFSLFNAGVNVGAFAGPLVCGALAEAFGFPYGFTVCALGMLVALATYLAGWRDLPPDTIRAQPLAPKALATKGGSGAVAAICLLILFDTLFKVAYVQESNILFVWVRDHTDRHVGGFEVPIAWLTSLDGLLCVVLTPVLMAIWRRAPSEGTAKGDLGKLVIGYLFGAAAMALVALGSSAAGAARVGLGWSVGCVALGANGFLYTWPPLLALISRAAPERTKGTLFGVAFLSPFAGSLAAGWLGRSYETSPGAPFWMLHAVICLAGGAGVALLSGWLAPRLAGAPAAGPAFPGTEAA
jgi:POT family proton-dependent oligopeptide transporter